jgi:hypothetical protein
LALVTRSSADYRMVGGQLARLTLARKIAAITLTLWKKGERFNVEHLKAQAA